MKRIIAMVMCIATVLTSTVFVAAAGELENPAVKISDSTGFDGYSAATDILNAKVKAEGGATLVMDVKVESYTEAPEGSYSQLVAFSGGAFGVADYNYLSYDFEAKAFKAGQSQEWVTNNQEGFYETVATNSFDWESDRWYELAFRFNGTKAAIYLNGICVISTEFDKVITDYLLFHPQYCTVLVDNVKVCAKDYDVAKGVGSVWAAEDFDGVSSASGSDVWYFEDPASITMSGCDGVKTTIYDNGVKLSDTDGLTGYASPLDTLNEKIVDENGVTFVADVLVESYTEPTDGAFSQIVAFTGTSDYNYAAYDFTAGAFKTREGSAWVSDSQTDTYTERGSKNFAWETGVWYELAYQFNGNTVKIYLDGKEMLSTTYTKANTEFFILYPQFCDIRIDNIRVCDKNYDVADGVGTVYAAEDFSAADAVANSEVMFFDIGYTLSNKGIDAYIPGDVDDNGTVDVIDYTTLTRIVKGVNIKYGNGADVDMNGSIDSLDVSLLARIIKGYAYNPNLAVAVTPVSPDNSAVVEGGNTPDTPVEPDEPEVTTSTTKTETSATTTQKPAVVPSGTFIDGLDGSTLRFDGKTAASYTFFGREGGIELTNFALSFDVLVSEVDASADFAGLGVWNGGNGFVGYDFNDQCFAYEQIGYSYPSALNNGTKLSLKVGEWNHFTFKRVDNNTFYVFVNGELQAKVANQNYTNTFFLFGFKNCTAYVDNYQAYINDEGKGLYDSFSGFTKDGGMLTSPDGGCWLIGDQGFGEICTTKVSGSSTDSGVAGSAAAAGIIPADTTTTTATPYDPSASVANGSGDTSKNDDSVLKFDALNGASYSLLFSDQPQSYTDMALTFDVKIESVNAAEKFAGLGVWSGNGDRGFSQFTGYDFNDQQFTSDSNTFYPNAPDAGTGPKMNLKVGEWNHFCFRRLNNNTFEVYVNGTLCYKVTGQAFSDTYFIFAFKNVVAYVDNYQYYHSGIACGLVDDFNAGASTDSEGYMRFSDGGYWVVYTKQNFGGVVGPTINQANVDAVIAKINALGTITYNSGSAITTAENAYKALTAEEKALVTNYSTLTAARNTWNALDAEVVTYKNTVAALPSKASNTDACKTAIANCAIAYATLTSPGQVDAVKTEKAKYDAFRAEWEALVDASTSTSTTKTETSATTQKPADPPASDVDMGSGSGDKSGIDGSALKFTASGGSSYSLLFSDQPQSYTDMALTFDVKIESIDSGVDFAGLGVWSGNGTDVRSSFTGYDFADQRFVSDNNTFFPNAPSANSNVKMSLKVGEWNHFCFRRLNNNTFEVYVNGKLCYSVTGYNYADTYYIFGFKNCTAYVDNYQYYHSGTACGLVTDFTTGATTDANGDTRFSDGGYWVVGSLNYAGVVKGQPGFDGSALKFNGNSATSYTLVLNEGPISNTDVALTFDVYVESIDSAANFAGLGVWNGDGTFIGYDFKDQKFTAAKSQGYPYPPDSDNGGSLKLNVGEWNHFVFRRLNNTSFVVYVNGVKGAEITGLSFSNTYMIFGFKGCVAYVDNYQAYENGAGKGLVTDFSKFTNNGSYLVSPDGGYWMVGTQGFDCIYTTKSGGVTGSSIAGTNKVPGSSAIDGTCRITLESVTPEPETPPVTPDPPATNPNLQKILTNIQNSGNIAAAKKTACKQVATELYNLGYETAFIAGVIGNVCYEGNTGIFEYYNTNTNYHPNFNSYLQTYYGSTYKAMFSGKYVYNLNLNTVFTIFNDLNNRGWSYNGVRIGTGVGCIQWTFGRSFNLIKIYREVTNNGSSITYEQTLAAEGLMVSRELSGSYKSVYNTWKKNNSSNINSQTAAYNAAYDVCVKYEAPSDKYNKAVTRGNFAKLVYADLVK